MQKYAGAGLVKAGKYKNKFAGGFVDIQRRGVISSEQRDAGQGANIALFCGVRGSDDNLRFLQRIF